MTPLTKMILPVVLSISLTGCYTVLRESSEYYSEFSDDDVSDSVETEDTDDTIRYDDPDQTVIIQRYYSSPWCPPYYPYSGWWVSVGYVPGYVHVVDPLWHWSYYYYGYDYYWNGCWYPTAYAGPDYYYNPRPHYPVYGERRTYGLRASTVNTSFDASAIATANRRATAGSIRFKTADGKSSSATSKEKASKPRDNAKRSYRPKSTQTQSRDRNTHAQTKREGSRSGGGREVRGNSGSKRSGESRSSGRSEGRSGGKRKYN